jgi:hypothetical protein
MASRSGLRQFSYTTWISSRALEFCEAWKFKSWLVLFVNEICSVLFMIPYSRHLMLLRRTSVADQK